MKKGTVKWFNDKKGYGFITGEDGVEYFVHFSDVVSEGYRSLQAEQCVEFEAGECERGLKAVGVKAI